VIFIDANVIMYLVGAPHPNKQIAERLMDQLVSERQELVTDAEVLQEILHRYSAIGRQSAIRVALDALLELVDDVVPIDRLDVLRAAEIVAATSLGARDSLHIAVMERRGITSIFTFDKDFDRWPSLNRLPQA
jgi:uncharacterized protein